MYNIISPSLNRPCSYVSSMIYSAMEKTILHDVDYLNDSVLDQYDQHNDGIQQETYFKNFKRKHQRTSDLSKNRLDLYLPILNTDESDSNGATVGKPPLVVYVHGGGWRRGDRQQWGHFISSYDTNLLFALIFRFTRLHENIGETFAQNGSVCAVISYPLQQPHILVTLFELFISFCMSTLLSTGLFTFLMLLFHQCAPSIIHAVNHTINECDYRKCPYSTFLSLCLTQSQLFTWSIIICNIKNYRDGLPKCIIASIPSALLAYGMLSYFNPATFHTSLWTFSFLLIVYLQASIAASQIYHTLNSKRITCDDQIKAVAKSFKWLKTFGDKTGKYDSSKIVLAGHSAGSHLINMLIWDEKYLQDTNVSICDVKGIISLSGVHNLNSINRGLTKHLYLSTFGSDPHVWEKLSPVNQVTMRTTTSSPEFLIITAEHDFDFLKKDGRDYVEKLKKYGYEVQYEVIPSCNHLSLPMQFGGSESGGKLDMICLDFIQKFK